MSEHLDSATLDSDEDGFTLALTTDEADYRICVDLDAGRQLLVALEPLREWIAEGDRQRVLYDRASPQERAAVLRVVDDSDCGYALDDPKHPTYYERMVG